MATDKSERNASFIDMKLQFSVGVDFFVKCSDLRSEKADGVIFPINTEFAVGGSSADVLITVDQARKRQARPLSTKPVNTYDFLFPMLNIKDPLDLTPGTVILDLKTRPRVAELGTAQASRSLREAGLQLVQTWDRVIAAFVRHQGCDVSKESISRALFHALTQAEECHLVSITMVPFGTGFGGISAQHAAGIMVPVIMNYVRDQRPVHVKSITILMFNEMQFQHFSTVAAAASRKVRSSETEMPPNHSHERPGAQ